MGRIAEKVRPQIETTILQVVLAFQIDRACSQAEVVLLHVFHFSAEFAAASLGSVHFSVAARGVWNSLPDHLRDPAVDPNNLGDT